MSDSCGVFYGIQESHAFLQVGYELCPANWPDVHSNEHDEREEIEPDRNVDPSEDLVYSVHDSLRDWSCASTWIFRLQQD